LADISYGTEYSAGIEKYNEPQKVQKDDTTGAHVYVNITTANCSN